MPECRQAVQSDVAPFLHRQVDGGAVGRPDGRALAVVDGGADLAAVAAVPVHHPHVCVFHRGLEVGQPAPGTQEDDTRAVR